MIATSLFRGHQKVDDDVERPVAVVWNVFANQLDPPAIHPPLIVLEVDLHLPGEEYQKHRRSMICRQALPEFVRLALPSAD